MMRFAKIQKQNSRLKNKLFHDQLRHDCYSFNNFKREMSLILNFYKYDKSIFKAASHAGVRSVDAMRWYVEGMHGNPLFRGFYLVINELNKPDESPQPIVEQEIKKPSEEYKISKYGDGWCYTTYIDDEKIFLISKDLDNLKMKVKSRNLPLN